MKTDFYTKSVLTVIAIALTFIAFQNMEIIPEVSANKSIPGYVSVPLNADGSISVKFAETMKVNLAEIGGSYVYGTLPVNIKEFSGSSVSSSGMPVNIKSVDGSAVYGSGVPVNIKALDGSSVYGGLPVKMKN